MATGSFWGRVTQERISRRRALQMAGVGAASAGAIAIVGCGGGNDNDKTPTAGTTKTTSGGGNIKRGGTARGTLPLITGKDPHPAASFIPHAIGSYTYSRLMRFKTVE